MATNEMSAIFKKIAEAKANGGGNMLKDGDYVLEVERLLIEKKFGGTFWISEFRVVEAIPVTPTVDPNKVGTQASWVCNLEKNLSAPGNLKSFILALYNEDEANATPDDLSVAIGEAVSDKQPAKGLKIRMSTFHKPSRAGKDLLLYKWSPYTEDDAKA